MQQFGSGFGLHNFSASMAPGDTSNLKRGLASTAAKDSVDCGDVWAKVTGGSMTKITANIILLTMAWVWAWLSVTEGIMQPVSNQFLLLAGALASGDIGSVFMQKFNKQPEQK